MGRFTLQIEETESKFHKVKDTFNSYQPDDHPRLDYTFPDSDSYTQAALGNHPEFDVVEEGEWVKSFIWGYYKSFVVAHKIDERHYELMLVKVNSEDETYEDNYDLTVKEVKPKLVMYVGWA